MSWDNITYLGMKNTDTVTDEFGDLNQEYIFETDYIFCNEKSVKYSEFYQAHAVGLKPTLVLEVMIEDYNSNPVLLYDNEVYSVLRTYKINKDKIELTLTRGIHAST